MTRDDDKDPFVVGLHMIRDLFAVIGIIAAVCMTLGYVWGYLG